ncbi:MAG: TRAP transporter large permease subunit [Pseudomonadota bacterium]
MIDHLETYIGGYMFLALAILLFTGLPVGMVLGGTALVFGAIGIWLDITTMLDFYLFVERLWQGAAENPVLVAIPCFIFMGTMLERSQVASDLLDCLNVLLRRIPGGLALAVTLMGTIMAATTGIIGASVVMMTMMALPKMLDQQYDPQLATGTLAASATLGILIPPSIMLVIMADLLAVSVGNLFVGAVIPGLMLSMMYFLYIAGRCWINPALAPKPSSKFDAMSTADVARILLRGLLPPVFLISLVLGSIFAGWATPTEAAGVGGFGAILLAIYNRKLNRETLSDTCHRTTQTTAMIFFIFMGATSFSYMFRALYGEDLIIEFIDWLELGPWGLLTVILVVVFLLGFFFDWIEITLIILPVFGPILAEQAPMFIEHIGAEGLLGSDAQKQVIYWFAILFAINLQTSFLTPPFGFALFYMKGAAPTSVAMIDIYKGIIPFVLLQLAGLLAVVFWPQIALYLPSIALQ